MVDVRVKYASQRVNDGQSTAFRQRQTNRKRYNRVGGHLRVHTPEQFLNPLACQGGYEHRRRGSASARTVDECLSLFKSEPVHLIQHAQPGTAINAKLPQNLIHFLVEFVVVRIGDVAHVQYQSGFLHLFESRAKRCQQTIWQIADKSDGIGNQDAAVRGKAQCSDRWIERREPSGGKQNFGAAQRIKQGGFARVRVAHEGDRPERNGVARLAPQRPLLADIITAGFDLSHAIANTAAVGLEFLFTGSTHADAPRTAAGSPGATASTFAAEARHRGSFSGQAGKHVIQLRQFDLQLAFTAPRMTGKNIKNQLSAVDYPAIRRFFNVALLHRRKIAVENDQRRFVRRGLSANFVQLAAANQRCRVVEL